MSYQQAVNNFLGNVARSVAIERGVSVAQKQLETSGKQLKASEKIAGSLDADLFVGKERSETGMLWANEKAERMQEVKKIQKERMAYFAGKFWKEQK